MEAQSSLFQNTQVHNGIHIVCGIILRLIVIKGKFYVVQSCIDVKVMCHGGSVSHVKQPCLSYQGQSIRCVKNVHVMQAV